MSFKGVTTNRLNGGLGRRNPTNDGVGMLIIGSGVAATGLAINTIQKLLSVENAETLGITAAYDDTNSILAHHHIDEFFRLAPDGTLYIVLATALFTDAVLKTTLRENDDIRFVGVVRNDATVIVLANEIGRYQTVADELQAEHIHIDAILIEGSEYDGAVLAAAYEDLRALDKFKVSVVISQDPIIRALKAEYEKYAAIGAALGMLSVRRVNENLGSVNIERKPTAKKGTQDYPLTDSGRQRFIGAVLQNGVVVDGMSENEKKQLTTFGYIYVGSYVGYAGMFFNSSPTCALASSDYAYIENNRVWNKASRLLRAALMPRIKGNLLKDPATGFIRQIEATELEAIGLRAINTMVSSEEISGADVYINPEQAIDENTALVIKVELVINDIIYSIDVDLGLTTNTVNNG